MKYQDLRDSALLDEIEDKCQEAIQACRETGMLLYRGVVDSIGDEKHLTIRTDRRPRDSKLEIHNAVERWMTENGLDARRSNSIFVTTNKRETRHYGEVYIIFPLDGFSTTYFEHSFDLTDVLTDPKLVDAAKRNDYNTVEEYLLDDNLDDIMSVLKPVSDDLVGGMKSGNEIMIANTTYWALKARKWEDVLWDRFIRD